MVACSVKSDDKYEDESGAVQSYTTTWQPNNSDSLITTRPSNVDKRQDRSGEEESKEKRNAHDRVEDNAAAAADGDGEDALIDAISANITTIEKDDALKKGTTDQQVHSKKASESTYDGAIVKEDGEKDDDEEEEEAGEEKNSGNSSLQHSSSSALTTNSKANRTSAAEDEEVEEDEDDAKPRMIHLVRRPSHQSNHVNGHENETGDEEEEEEDDDEDDEDDYEDETIANNVCTAGYFLDKIIPEDYPTEITKEVNHINETIERINRSVQLFLICI